MTKDIVKNGDAYWFDADGNSLVVAADGNVYLVLDDDTVHYVTDDIRRIYDEETGDYVIDGMNIANYINSVKKAAEVSSVRTTAAVTEPPAETTEKQTTAVTEAKNEKSAVSETTTVSVPAQVIYQTVYQAPETSAIQTTVGEKTTYTEEENIEESEYEADTLSSEAQETVTAVSEGEAEGTETAVSSVPQETGVISDYIEEEAAETTEYSENTETEAVTEAAAPVNSNRNDAASFILLSGVFGAAIAAAVVYVYKEKKKKRSETADISQLSARERDEIRLNSRKRKKPRKNRVSKRRIVPRTVQKTLPYKRICDDYLIKVDENKYSKTYCFEDVNYSIAKQEEQEGIFLGYCSVLNSFDTSADIQITVHNNRVDKEKFNEMVLLKHKGNEFDRYVDVYNDMLIEKMEQGQNGIIRNKYLTVTIQTADLETAQAKFVSIDLELLNAFKKIGSAIVPLTANERVKLLKDIFRSVDTKIPTLSMNDFNRQAERAYCCPEYFEFKKDYLCVTTSTQGRCSSRICLQV